MVTNAISLDENQTAVVARSFKSVQVRDSAGALVGHLVPGGAESPQARNDRWIACWTEWYLESDEEEPEKPETD